MSLYLLFWIVPLLGVGVFLAFLLRLFDLNRKLLFVHQVFDFAGFLWIQASKTAERPHADRGETKAEHQAHHIRPLLGSRRNPNAPGDAERPNAVGEVKHAGEN